MINAVNLKKFFYNKVLPIWHNSCSIVFKHQLINKTLIIKIEKQGNIMKKFRLLEVSAFVVVAAVASAAVNADDNVVKLEKKAMSVKADKVVEAKTLFEPLDADKNGLLTENELGTEKNTLLKKQFKKIDKNADNAISQEELSAYLAKVEVKNNL